MMKLCKYITVILLSAIFISGCNSVKETLSLKKKDNNDEFLVKKKKPLTLPPNFNDLPKPESKTSGRNNEDEVLDFSKILKESKVKKQMNKKKNKSLERSISKILNSN